MKKIYKYPVPENSVFALKIPSTAEILSVRVIDGKAFMWVLLNPHEPGVSRIFEWHVTGGTIPIDPGEFVDTFIIDEFVYHLFEIT